MPILIAFSVMSVLLPKADILEGTAKSPFMTLSGHRLDWRVSQALVQEGGGQDPLQRRPRKSTEK